MNLNVVSAPSQRLAFTNCVYLNDADFAQLRTRVEAVDSDVNAYGINCLINNRLVFAARALGAIDQGGIGLNGLQRRFGQFTLNQGVAVEPVVSMLPAATLSLEIGLLSKSASTRPTLEREELTEHFMNTYLNQGFLAGQLMAVSFNNMSYMVKVLETAGADIGGNTTVQTEAVMLLRTTDVEWRKAADAPLNLSGGGSGTSNAVFRPDFDFASLGIGGLDEEFSAIFRRAFASRIFPTTVVRNMGLNHVRGMLLFGPPGCGKTLIARQIGRVLNAREPQIINGPEVLNKFVGASEERIRELFAPAEEEQASAGDDSMLHIIIFDEIDAICKKRGSVRDGTGVSDSIVNQLLSKIDGVNSLNNILVIGMTNRKDMIDDALLRPGRMEVHVEIGLPTESGRVQILNIHTAQMRQHGYLSQEVGDAIPDIARRTKNYTGAEIEGLVRCAASYAFNRQVDVADLSKPIDPANVSLEMQDIELALQEVLPAFGTDTGEIAAAYRNGIVNYGASYSTLRATLDQFVEQTRHSVRTPLMSCLLHGAPGTGKSALAAKLAIDAEFPFVRVVSPDALIGYSETAKCGEIAKVFEDAYKSPLSIIILDDIERLLNFVAVGPHFSNVVLQALMVLVKKPPPVEGRRLMVIGITAIPDLLEQLQLTTVFNVSLRVPELCTAEEIRPVVADAVPSLSEDELERISSSFSQPIGIKKLLMLIEMAREDDGSVDYARFMECVVSCGFC